MTRPIVAALLSAWALTLADLARADAVEYPVSILEGALPTCLKALENQTGVELLYDGSVVREFRAPSVVGKFTTEAALQQLLSETELTVRRATSGAWIIERRTTAPLAQQDAAVAEILVVGRRTQNADIRRFEDDVQPYTVATQEEIASSHRDTVDQYLSSRITSNTTMIPSLASQNAGVMSSINLRGMGDLDTVVLVDGRRMPSIPHIDIGFLQTDLNAIPMHAIERIEVLTGAASGIHGFGALGGVVNVVLDHDVDGFEVHTSQGVSSRGDARRHGMEAKFGRSFGDGATDFTMFAAHQELDSLQVDERDFADRDRRRTYETAPDFFRVFFPTGNSVGVSSLYGIDPDTFELVINPILRFKPEFGGGTLGSNVTYLPLGFSGDAAALVAALEQHAGEVDFRLSEDEAKTELGSNPQSDALLANLRHTFESGWEAYADVVMLRNRGETVGAYEISLGGGTPLSRWGTSPLSGSAWMFAESPANPFTDLVSVTYPIPNLNGRAKRRLDNTRYTAGVEAPLPFDWRGTAEASWGELRSHATWTDALPLGGLSFFLFGDESDLETNPLGDWANFDRVIRSDTLRSTLTLETRAEFKAQSIRLAGPVFTTSAGPAMLTLLAERRSEHAPPGPRTFVLSLDESTSTTEFLDDPRSRVTHSYYGELRTRLFDESGLELQLAVRRDEQEDEFQRTQVLPDAGLVNSRFAATAYTVGAKISPTRWLMLRGSYATGDQPPPIENLSEIDPISIFPSLTPDPKRGDTLLGSEADGVLQLGGNLRLKTARAKTLFLGTVITPTGPDGPKFAIDYSRIRKERDVHTFSLTEIMANEDDWPERVQRAPLTDADRENGYTGGVVEMIDARVTNDGALHVDAFDLRAEWPLTFLDGRLRLYADATYHQRNVQKARFQPDVPFAGYLQGPLKRRANGGFDWSRNQLTIGANLQYFGSSLIYSRDFVGVADEFDVLVQGLARIPSQTYLDLYGSWRLPVSNLGALDSFAVDFGIINVMDKAPPRESLAITVTGPGFSRYGDPRMRRYELGVSVQF